MASNYDFSGWVTRYNVPCSDGRTILPNSFVDDDKKSVPLVWNHQHDSVMNVLGTAVLEHCAEGVRAHCTFNDTENGQYAKKCVKSGNIFALSICANQLKERAKQVMHGAIREVSLVLAGANPQAYIDPVLTHSDDDSLIEAYIYLGTPLDEYVEHHQDPDENEFINYDPDNQLPSNDGEAGTKTEEINHSAESAEEEKKKMADTKEKTAPETSEKKEEDGKTIGDIYNGMTKEQQDTCDFLVNAAVEETKKSIKEDDKEMKHNAFEGNDLQNNTTVLTHADQVEILELAKTRSVGSLKEAMRLYTEQQSIEQTGELQHGIDDIEVLFPEFKNVGPAAPEMLTRDMDWVDRVISKVTKAPYSRVRTRQMDVRDPLVKAYGYQKGKQKKVSPNIKLLSRTTDPQTVYRKDALHKDDIIDITDFDVVEYQYKIMRMNLNEMIAIATMIGDGLEEGDEMKISEDHIRSIWHDDELYSLHTDVDFDAAAEELQGSDTGVHFGENYIYAEAIITAALYKREEYKGSGNMDFYCTPHLLNIMLLARDLNGRRIYNSKADLAAALNVNEIYTVEQFEGKTRVVGEGPSAKTKKLLGIFVNLTDYQYGKTKGGEITSYNQFDIDFNQEKFLLETRLSGALIRPFSAICLEEDVTAAPGGNGGQ